MCESLWIPNRTKARLVVTSMIAQGYFKQISLTSSLTRKDPKVQKVPTKDMSQDLTLFDVIRIGEL